MTEFINRIFGRDVHQAILDYFNEMRAKGSKFAQEMRLSGILHKPSDAVFGFLESDVGVTLDVKFEVEDNKRAYITNAFVKLKNPWLKTYFFFCRQDKQFSFPSFPSVAELKAKWCQIKIASQEKHPDGGEWCATDEKTRDDYYFYGKPPKSFQECSMVRSMEVYAFHFEPASDGINVKSDIRYDLRFPFSVFGYIHLDNGGKKKKGFDVSDYFVGGLMLGGAYEDFKKLLAKTKASMDCTPALEGLLQSMMGPTLATR